MPATTPRYGFPYPTANDTLAAFPGTIKDLALAVEGKIAALAAGELVPSEVETITPLPPHAEGQINLPPVVVTSRSLVAFACAFSAYSGAVVYLSNTPSLDDATSVYYGAGVLDAGTWYPILAVDPQAPAPEFVSWVIIPV